MGGQFEQHRQDENGVGAMTCRAIVATVCCTAGLQGIAQGALSAHVGMQQLGGMYSYTLVNDEPDTSGNYLNAFHLTVDAAIIVIGTPSGWDFITDGVSYVEWFSTDAVIPYPHDVGPQSMLGGFVIESSVLSTELLPFSIAAWDHVADDAGPGFQDFVTAPSVPTPGGVFVLSLGGVLLRRGRSMRSPNERP